MLLAAGGIFNEFAGVSYNAMLPQVSTPATLGRVSGFGWSMGYFGGIFLLLVCYFGFIQPEVGWFGVTNDGGLDIRAVAVFSALWFLVFGSAVFFAVPEVPPGPAQRRVGIVNSYRLLGLCATCARYGGATATRSASRRLRPLPRRAGGRLQLRRDPGRQRVRDGGVDRAGLGVAANVVAAAGALVLGRVEDVVGPGGDHGVAGRAVVSCLVLLFVRGTPLFWVLGLALCQVLN